ncbi:MAG: serine/threonine-protein kinase [Sandaracinaceae bacterium]
MSPSPQPQDERRTFPSELGRFTLLRELGAGGMATVYLGKMRLAEGLERLVAVKTIHDELAGQDAFVDMFLDEAKIATLISHPNVCAVHDFGQAGDTYYMAMEYLVGEPLSEVIRQLWEFKSDTAVMQALPFLGARIIADACEGLHAAHQTTGAGGQLLEVVHRDVSPQNLFVTYEGAVKVVDFGCAKALQRITETNVGIFKGKLAYAAPEQLRIRKLDARTDVWALGAVLWETLTMERVFKKDSPMETARMILETPIRRIDEVDPYMPTELADIVQKALTRDPEERFQSARDMGRALRRFIAGAGATFESAESADWMRYLFRQRRREQMEVAAKAEMTLASHVIPTETLLGTPAPSDSPRNRPTSRPPAFAAPRSEPMLPAPARAPDLEEFSDLSYEDSMSDGDSFDHARTSLASPERRPESVNYAADPVPPSAPSPPTEPDLEELSSSALEAYEEAPDGDEEGRSPSRRLRLDAADQFEGRRAERRFGWAPVAVVAALAALGGGAYYATRPAETPTPVEAADATGTVIVRASGAGEAEVFQGERSLGRTPLTAELAAGEQTLTLRFDSNLVEEVVVPVQSGQTARITVRPR